MGLLRRFKMGDRPTMLNKQTLLLLVMAPWLLATELWLPVTAPRLLLATFRLLTSKPR